LIVAGATGESAISKFVIKGREFDASHIEPALYIAATPIGNLGDVTIRTLETLAGCDLIACEDTRVTAKLLRHYAIDTKTIAYHEHNAAAVGPKLLETINQGCSVVLVSDAGTPLVSDPGFRLVEACKQEDISVIPLPGASATLAALVASGLPADNWEFAGFLPSKEVARKKQLKKFVDNTATTLFFESPNRLGKTLRDMQMIFGDSRPACIAREITKLHEQVVTSTVGDLVSQFDDKSVKGEIVLLVGPCSPDDDPDPETLLLELMETMPVSRAAAEASELVNLSKRDLYQMALSLKEKG